jgi:hypothetical protein
LEGPCVVEEVSILVEHLLQVRPSMAPQMVTSPST